MAGCRAAVVRSVLTVREYFQTSSFAAALGAVFGLGGGVGVLFGSPIASRVARRFALGRTVVGALALFFVFGIPLALAGRLTNWRGIGEARAYGAWLPCLGGGLEPRRLPPLREALGPDLAVLVGGEEVAARTEVVVDGAERFQEALGVIGRCEALEHALSFADGAVGVLCAVVHPLVPPVLHAREHAPQCGRVAGQLVRGHHPRRLSLPVEHPAQEPFGRFLVAAVLHEDVEHESVLVHRPPQPVFPAFDLELHLVQVPFASRGAPMAAQTGGEGRAKRAAPEPDCFVADPDAPLRQQVLDVAVAQGEPEVQPHGMTDDLGRKPIARYSGSRAGVAGETSTT